MSTDTAKFLRSKDQRLRAGARVMAIAIMNTSGATYSSEELEDLTELIAESIFSIRSLSNHIKGMGNE